MIWTLWIPLVLTLVGFVLTAASVAPTAAVLCFLVGLFWLVGSGVRVGWRALRGRKTPAKMSMESVLAPRPVVKAPPALAVPSETTQVATAPISVNLARPALPRWADERERTAVVGESHYQGALADISKARDPESKWLKVQAVLTPEVGNAFDAMAVSISVQGQRVGYLARDDARRFRRLLEKRGIAGHASECDALVRGGYIGRGGEPLSFGVDLLFSVNGGELERKFVPPVALDPFADDPSLSDLYSRHQDTLRLMLYVARADGAMRAPEVAIIAAHCSVLSAGLTIKPEQVLRLLGRVEAPSPTTFTRLYNAMRRERADEAEQTAAVLRAIIGTQKMIHPAEIGILEALDKPLPKAR